MSIFRPLEIEDIESDDRYIQAKEFSLAFEPVEGRSYKWVYEYSIKMLNNARETLRALDTKAENMVRYVGSGSGILGIGFAWFASKGTHTDLLIWALVSIGILLIIWAILSALQSITPTEQTLGASVIDAIKIVDHYGDEEKSLGYYATGLAKSIVMIRIVAEKKASYLRRSHSLFSLGLLFIVLSVVVSFIQRSSS
jgi:hypothetical protein